MEHEKVKAVIDYNENTGEFRWKTREESDRFVRSWNKRHAGNVAGSLTTHGYFVIVVFGVRVYAHRLAWFITFGTWPDQIDHINGNRLDNSLRNLRCVSVTENNRNQGLRSNNKSGFCGVHKTGGTWAAQIRKSGKGYHIGSYKTAEEAFSAREKVKLDMGFHINHGKASK